MFCSASTAFGRERAAAATAMAHLLVGRPTAKTAGTPGRPVGHPGRRGGVAGVGVWQGRDLIPHRQSSRKATARKRSNSEAAATSSAPRREQHAERPQPAAPIKKRASRARHTPCLI